jgi:DNA-directed RNA polymerase subunit F
VKGLPKRTINVKPITISSVKEILEKRQNELDQFQRRTLEYAIRFSKIEATKAEELINVLVEKFEIDRDTAVQIINCMPKGIGELRVFFVASKRKIIPTTQLEEILKILDKYR